MNIVFLCGGTGSRLWPISGEYFPKQFVQVLKDENGNTESMVQRMVRGVRKQVPEAKIVFATSAIYADLLKQQLGENINISIEPERRNTFPAIALAAAYLRDVMGEDEESSFVVCPVDPYVEDDYFTMLAELFDAVQKNHYRLMLSGIMPDRPSPKYGYIIPENNQKITSVREFKEKPTPEIATEFIKEGALWNAGVFSMKIGYVLDRVKDIYGITSYKELLEGYADLKKISFDYAVVEKENSIGVLCFEGTWRDIGTWDDFSQIIDESVGNKIYKDTSSRDTTIVNQTNIPVVCVGCQNLAVVVTEAGVLVIDKEKAAELTPLVEQLNADKKNKE